MDPKAWLALHSDPAEINVDGLWDSNEWGKVLFHQAKGSREVTGTADNWEVQGVVSHKSVYIAFSYQGTLTYTAEVTLNDLEALTGSYSKGILQPGSEKTGLTMTRVKGSEISPAAAPGVAEDALAHVVVYRKHSVNHSNVVPPIYLDGKKVADLEHGHYLTLNLSPGKHLIGSIKVGKMGSQTEDLDLAPGSTTYINFEFASAWVNTLDILKTDAPTALSELGKLKPSDAKKVKMPEMVSLDPITK